VRPSTTCEAPEDLGCGEVELCGVDGGFGERVGCVNPQFSLQVGTFAGRGLCLAFHGASVFGNAY